ncbi:MAG: glycosyltransferase [Opitutae bacterium]|nr:glycosyltransferase [Opitutae bacterium]
MRALANAQAKRGEAVELLATIEPGQPEPDTRADSARVVIFPRQAPLRLCRSAGLRRHLLAQPVDCVHHHALWLLPLHYAHEAAHRHGVPLVISPRGMLSGWALQHHSWRKKFAELFIHPGAFDHAAGWHATSEAEADDIRAAGFKQPVCVSPNGVEVPTPEALASARAVWLARHPALAGRRVALFYSRFHRKKRVRELIDLWTSAPRGDWVLLVAGLPEEYSVAELAQRAANQVAAGEIVIADSTGLPPPYAVAELFVLPSHSENFGLVIAEALAAGVPALVTETTPWSGLSAHEAGWCVPWAGYARALEDALALPADRLAALGKNARSWIARDYTWESAAGLLCDFYRQVRHV